MLARHREGTEWKEGLLWRPESKKSGESLSLACQGASAFGIFSRVVSVTDSFFPMQVHGDRTAARGQRSQAQTTGNANGAINQALVVKPKQVEELQL